MILKVMMIMMKTLQMLIAMVDINDINANDDQKDKITNTSVLSSELNEIMSRKSPLCPPPRNVEIMLT